MLTEEVIMLIAALGSKAHSVVNIQENLDMYRRWYAEECEVALKLRENVTRLKEILDNHRIEY